MALSLSQFSPAPSSSSLPSPPKFSNSNLIIQINPKPIFKHTSLIRTHRCIIPKATQKSTNKNSASEAEIQTPSNEIEKKNDDKTSPDGQIVGGGDEVSELGAEIKKAMKERAEKEQELSLSGVAEEIREIEWPAFNKVLGTTGVVIGVIAGSSVVLLTVNAVLAELSDRVFAGKGIQDFFS